MANSNEYAIYYIDISNITHVMFGEEKKAFLQSVMKWLGDESIILESGKGSGDMRDGGANDFFTIASSGGADRLGYLKFYDYQRKGKVSMISYDADFLDGDVLTWGNTRETGMPFPALPKGISHSLVVSFDYAAFSNCPCWLRRTGIFSIKNAGDKPVMLKNAYPACRGVHVDFSPREIPPETTVDIPFAIDANTFNGFFVTHIFVETDKAEQELLVVPIDGEMVSPIDILDISLAKGQDTIYLGRPTYRHEHGGKAWMENFTCFLDLDELTIGESCKVVYQILTADNSMKLKISPFDELDEDVLINLSQNHEMNQLVVEIAPRKMHQPHFIKNLTHVSGETIPCYADYAEIDLTLNLEENSKLLSQIELKILYNIGEKR